MLVLPELTPEADWSVCIRDAATGEVVAESTPGRVLKTASIGKVFLLVEAAARLASGEQDPGEPLGWRDEEYVDDSGLWYRLRSRALPFVDLCALVGAFSDNLATNVIVRHLGLDAAYARAREMGCADSGLHDRVRSAPRPPTASAEARSWGLSSGRADELSAVMVALERGEAVSPEVSRLVLHWLGAGADLSMVAAAFGLDPLAHDEPDRGIHLVNKTGTISTARVDIGIVRGPARALAYAVGANWAAGADPRDRVLADMAAVGERLRAHVTA